MVSLGFAMPGREFDYVLVGGGLQNALIALALAERSRPPRVALIERGSQLGGNHTWCFHEDDVPGAARRFVARLVSHRWSGYEVRFPDHRRRLAGEYSAILSDQLDRVVKERFAQAMPGSALFLGRGAARLSADQVELDGGEVVAGGVVIDARGPGAGGPAGSPSGSARTPRDPAAGSPFAGGFQKFVGVE